MKKQVDIDLIVRTLKSVKEHLMKDGAQNMMSGEWAEILLINSALKQIEFSRRVKK